MSAIATAIVGSSVIGGMLSSDAQQSAAESASAAQTAASQASIAETKRQFDAIQELFKPFIQGGTAAFGQQQNLLGLGGAQAQQSAIDALQNSPMFKSLQAQGENRILANAAATGGLRGGNVQAALAQFNPSLLSQVIQGQFSNLGQLSNLGQASAAGQAAAGLQTGTNVSNLLGQIGAAQAGSSLASGQANAQMFGNIAGSIGNVAALKAFKVF